MNTHSRAWRFAVDRGGTFTDVVATTPDGTLLCGSAGGVLGLFADSEPVFLILLYNLWPAEPE